MKTRMKMNGMIGACAACAAFLGTASPAADLLQSGPSALAAPMQNQAPSAREAALGGAAVALDGPDALWANPAGLAGQKGLDFGLDHLSWIDGVIQESAWAAQSLGAWGGLGEGVRYADYGTFDVRDDQGNLTGSTTANGFEGQVGWGAAFDRRFSAGVSVEYSQSQLAGYAVSAYSGSVGATYKAGAGFEAAAAWENKGKTSDGSLMESSVDIGASETMGVLSDQEWVVTVQDSLEPSGVGEFQAGVEDLVAHLIALRLGYQSGVGAGDLAGFTAGVGVHYGPFNVDYAAQPLGDLGTAQRVDLAYHFGGTSAPGTKSTH
jgi:hypothetical protein